METISISKLKAHLSGELKKVQRGTRLVVLDHNHPVAKLVPLAEGENLFIREAVQPYVYRELTPLVNKDILRDIEEERTDRW